MHIIQIDINISSHDDPPMNVPNPSMIGPPIAKYSATFPTHSRRLPEGVKEALDKLTAYIDMLLPPEVKAAAHADTLWPPKKAD